MNRSPEKFIEKLNLSIPPIGFYDAPDEAPFEPTVVPEVGGSTCVFAFFNQWLKGNTLLLRKNNFSCGGSGTWLFNEKTRSREEYVKFLVDKEGLKASHGIMHQWLDHNRPYRARYPLLLIGPLKEDQYEYLKSVTFFLNPDQLSLAIIGAQYHSIPGDPTPVTAPFGSGCMHLVSLFEDLDIPQAIIGATDIAMRKYLDPNLIAFTVTKPMYERLCSLGKDSFLNKSFWRDLQKTRKNKQRISSK